MKVIFKKLRSIFGEILIVVGAGMASSNLLNFSFKRYSKYYYYSFWVTLCFAIGIMLIVSGILIIRRRKNYDR